MPGNLATDPRKNPPPHGNIVKICGSQTVVRVPKTVRGYVADRQKKNPLSLGLATLFTF